MAVDSRDGVVGFASVGTRTHWSGAVDAYIGELVTAATAEGRGVGTALVRAAEEWAAVRGHARITLETGAANTRAIEFYRRLGYVAEEVTLTRSLP